MGKHDPKKKTFNYKSSGMVEDCEGVKGATADFVCFHCPLVASAEAKPSATIKIKQRERKIFPLAFRKRPMV